MLNISVFNSVCVNVLACSIDNVVVSCLSATSNRRKRDTHKLIITYHQNIALPQKNNSINLDDLKRNVSTAFAEIANITRRLIDAGKLDSLGNKDLQLQLDRTSYETEQQQLNCPPGMVARINTYTCGKNFYNLFLKF